MIGVLIMEDEEGLDPKILSVLAHDSRFDGVKNISDIQMHRLIEIREFFETYKRLEPHKRARLKEWKNAEEAMEIVKKAMESYQKLPY